MGGVGYGDGGGWVVVCGGGGCYSYLCPDFDPPLPC